MAQVLIQRSVDSIIFYIGNPYCINFFFQQLQNISHITVKSSTEAKHEDCTSDTKNAGAAVADLVDLELELNSLQQGLTQMERITPLDPFNTRDDPFGDSFIAYPVVSVKYSLIDFSKAKIKLR